jgi:hypothetical protein
MRSHSERVIGKLNYSQRKERAIWIVSNAKGTVSYTLALVWTMHCKGTENAQKRNRKELWQTVSLKVEFIVECLTTRQLMTF